VTGPLFGDLAVLQACRAYEEAAGPSWPNPLLSSRLDAFVPPADPGVTRKQWRKRQ